MQDQPKTFIPCPRCDGIGAVVGIRADAPSLREGRECPRCHGSGEVVAERYFVKALPDHREPNAWGIFDHANGQLVRTYFGHEWPSQKGGKKHLALDVCRKLNSGEVKP
jgi:hypothetical protein